MTRPHTIPPLVIMIIASILLITAPAGAALITAKQVSNNSILSRHIKNGQVRSVDIGTRAITNRNLAIGAVKGNNLVAGSVGSMQIADGSITAADLAPDAVRPSALENNSITSNLIAGDAITSRELASASVGSSEIIDGSISTIDIADAAITSAKIATGAIGEAEIAVNAVDSMELASNAVQTRHISDGSVVGSALGKVVGVELEASSVNVPDDTLDPLPAEEIDGLAVPFSSSYWGTTGVWSVGSPTDIVVPSAGLYTVDAWVSWESDNDGYREAQIVADGAIVAQDRRPAGSGAIASRSNQVLSATFSVDAGDKVRLRISHNAGNPLNADRVRLTLRRVGTIS